jgi:hypothetical protein
LFSPGFVGGFLDRGNIAETRRIAPIASDEGDDVDTGKVYLLASCRPLPPARRRQIGDKGRLLNSMTEPRACLTKTAVGVSSTKRVGADAR